MKSRKNPMLYCHTKYACTVFPLCKNDGKSANVKMSVLENEPMFSMTSKVGCEFE